MSAGRAYHRLVRGRYPVASSRVPEYAALLGEIALGMRAQLGGAA